MLRFLLFSALSACATAGATAEFISQQLASQNRLTPLAKITVGPDDQYHGAIDPSGQALIFTKKSDLVPYLCRQDLKNGDVTPFLSLTADSQEAAISPRGLVAFTYYKFSARGDICYRPLTGGIDAKITCLEGDENERSSPFWKSDHELGYVVRDVKSLLSRVVVEDLNTHQKQTLVQGRVWSPAMKIDGNLLFYNQLQEGGSQRVLMMLDLRQGGSARELHFALPGISGFPSVSDDEQYLFFSHYLSDSNHDGIIDGNDNSVLFRVPIAQLAGKSDIFPEQLTSGESNCSFPRPFGRQLYVTCAFEGFLDVYRIPDTGIVPSTWDQKLLWSAHQSSRSYEERVLVLNTLKYRFPGQNSRELDWRLMSDHLFASDPASANYHLARLLEGATATERAQLTLLRWYLAGLDKKAAQPSPDEVSPTFRAEILEIDGKAAKVAGAPRFQSIVRGLLRTFLNETAESRRYLQQVSFRTPATPLERDYYFQLAQWTLRHDRSGDEKLDPVFQQTMSAPELSHESQIYYAFRFLQHLREGGAAPAARIHRIEARLKDTPKPVAQLLQSEEIALQIIQAPDAKAKQQIYIKLDRLMSESRIDYYLRKALYVRAIVNFAEAQEVSYLNYVASNWLRYTNRLDTEYGAAREVFADASYDRAYDQLGQNNQHFAGDYFYGALSLTDDLESHYGFVRAMLRQNQRATLEERYKNLVSRKMVGENYRFVEALLEVIDGDAKADGDTGYLDRAIEKLGQINEDRDSPVRYLLLGYCQLKKWLRTANGYDFDHELFDTTHRTLMLAYDIGSDNKRVAAAALWDLAILHQRAQDYGMAVKFFQRRDALGFPAADEANAFAWQYARSLYYAHQSDRAAEILAARLDKAGAWTSAFLERRAFYLQDASRWAESARAYEAFFAKAGALDDSTRARTKLAYGFVAVKLRKDSAARAALNEALTAARKLPRVPAGGARLIASDPRRIELAAQGFLSRLGSPAERRQAMEARRDLLAASKDLFSQWSDTNYWLELSALNRVQLAQSDSAANPARAFQELQEALAFTEQLGDAGQYLSHAVFQATADYLVQGILHPQSFRGQDGAAIQRVVEKSLAAYEKQKAAAAVMATQKTKLQLLWAAYRAKVNGGSNLDYAELRKLIDSEQSTPELDSLAEALSRS